MYGYNFNANSNYFNNYQQPQQDERIWVQNINGAESYLVAPNSFVRLWDSQQPMFYEKRADASGRPLPLECYKYEKITPRTANSSAGVTVDYTDKFEALNERISALEKEVQDYVSKSNADDSAV